VNRIILIGNGFDLAHGLKTGYTHFINSFWEDEKRKILSSLDKHDTHHNFIFDDEYIELKTNNKVKIINSLKESDSIGYKWFDKMISFRTKSFLFGNNDTSITTDIVIKNKFLERISEKYNLENWVNIEYEYYSALLECLNNDKAVSQLNEDFRFVQIALQIYLSEECKKLPPVNENIRRNIFSSLEENDLVLFLNFNYTRTLNSYTYGTRGTQTINIHGELDKPDNPIIFGYGDEIDENYSKLEKANNRSFLEYIKSIKYSLTTNYRDMLSFLELEDFEVYIMGLSCGSSDRTLLNTIFEHQKCKSIQIFFHQKDNVNDNYLETYINISRNFNSKKLLRSIVLPRPECVPLTP